MQGTRLLGDTDLPRSGPMTPEAVIMAKLRSEARLELQSNKPHNMLGYELLDPFEMEKDRFEEEVEDLAKSRLKKAMSAAGLS